MLRIGDAEVRMKELERESGDRASICELLYMIAGIADRVVSREKWERGDRWTSSVGMSSSIFDDLRIRDRAAMPDGYLGTYWGLPSDLGYLADTLDRFDAWWENQEPFPDLEILESELLASGCCCCSNNHRKRETVASHKLRDGIMMEAAVAR